MGFLAVSFFYLCLKQLVLKQSTIAFSTLLFVFSHTLYVLARRGRPEILFILLILIALYLYLRRRTNRSMTTGFGLGCVLSLGFWTHPNCAIILVLVGGMLLFNGIKKREGAGIVGYGLGSLSVFLAGIAGWACYREETLVEAVNQLLYSGRVSSETSFFSTFYSFVNQYCLGLKRLFIFCFESGFLMVACTPLVHKRWRCVGWVTLAVFVLMLSVLTPFVRSMFGVFVPIALITYAVCLIS